MLLNAIISQQLLGLYTNTSLDSGMSEKNIILGTTLSESTLFVHFEIHFSFISTYTVNEI